MQFENLFRSKQPRMEKVLLLIYEDILKFHRLALRYFQQPLWRQIFAVTWKDYRSQFDGIIKNFPRHQHLIESQANLIQIEQFQQDRKRDEERMAREMEGEKLRKLLAISNWLRPTDV